MTRTYHPPVSFSNFARLSGGWLIALFIVSRYIADLPAWVALSAVCLFSLPIAGANLYLSNLRHTRKMSLLKEGGWAFRLLRGKWGRTALWVIASWAMSLLMLLQFRSYGRKEWLLLVLLVPIFWLVHIASFRFLNGQLNRPDMILGFTLTVSRRICSGLALLAFAILLWMFGLAHEPASLKEAFRISGARWSNSPDTSMIVGIGVHALSMMDGFTNLMTHGSRKFDSRLPLLLSLPIGGAVFMSACHTFSCFAIPAKEFPKVLLPYSSEDGQPARVSRWIVAHWLIAAGVALFTFVLGFTALEHYLESHQEVSRSLTKFQQFAEKIDRLYRLLRWLWPWG
jgi:hypothetical protein